MVPNGAKDGIKYLDPFGPGKYEFFIPSNGALEGIVGLTDLITERNQKYQDIQIPAERNKLAQAKQYGKTFMETCFQEIECLTRANKSNMSVYNTFCQMYGISIDGEDEENRQFGIHLTVNLTPFLAYSMIRSDDGLKIIEEVRKRYTTEIESVLPVSKIDFDCCIVRGFVAPEQYPDFRYAVAIIEYALAEWREMSLEDAERVRILGIDRGFTCSGIRAEGDFYALAEFPRNQNVRKEMTKALVKFVRKSYPVLYRQFQTRDRAHYEPVFRTYGSHTLEEYDPDRFVIGGELVSAFLLLYRFFQRNDSQYFLTALMMLVNTLDVIERFREWICLEEEEHDALQAELEDSYDLLLNDQSSAAYLLCQTNGVFMDSANLAGQLDPEDIEHWLQAISHNERGAMFGDAYGDSKVFSYYLLYLAREVTELRRKAYDECLIEQESKARIQGLEMSLWDLTAERDRIVVKAARRADEDKLKIRSLEDRVEELQRELDAVRRDYIHIHEADDLLAGTDEEIRKVKEQNTALRKEIEQLRAENERLSAMPEDSTSLTLLTHGSEKELFPGEIRDIVLSTLISALDRVLPSQGKSRRTDVIRDIISANHYEGILQSRAENLKKVMVGYRYLDKTTQTFLESIGCAVAQKTGKHHKMTYYGDPRYTVTLPASGSDGAREGRNLAQDITTAFL